MKSSKKGTAQPERLTALYRTMSLIRQVETALTRLFANGEVPGFIHLSIGQEAVAAGVASALLPQDSLATTHRGHGHVLARGMPEVNCVWTADGILSLSGSDVGMAVDTDRGLLVPVLRNVGQRSLGGIAKHAGDLVGRAQAGRLGGAEMSGGAITVSNAGMHDVTYMTSIINPGQSMILGVGSIREVFRPDVNGQPAIRREMGMVLSADHRVLDGVAGLKFLKLVVQALSQPLGMMVA